MEKNKPIFIDNNSKIGVLLIHGFSECPDRFSELCSYLSEKKFNVYAPLIAGHGTHPDDLMKTSPKEWEESVKEAYEKLKGISQEIFLVGNSFGSNLAFWLIKEYDNEQKGVITLGAPIFLKYHWIIWYRLHSYGLFWKYYRVPKRHRKNMLFSYTDLPTKSLRNFLYFIKDETIPNLEKIKIPALICHSEADPIINPKSAKYIHKNISSSDKQLCLLQSHYHAIINDDRQKDMFEKIVEFIKKRA